MKELKKYEKYSRKDIHDIFSPDTNFTAGSGYWGLSGILKVPNTEKDYIFLVTYGQSQSNHVFDESIDENGILTWQSQPQQNLNTPQIIDFINHDETQNNIYLFLRESKKDDYTYLGLLAYISHDNERKNPVYFKWQILNWDDSKGFNSLHNIIKETNSVSFYDNLDELDIKLITSDNDANYINQKRRNGTKTSDFYSNRHFDFDGEAKKNTKLGNKGEDLVVIHEKEYLERSGKRDLANKVFATRILKGNAERFDVLSYELDGTEKYIEVKTTKGPLSSRFHISDAEVKFSEEHSDKYYLYRVYNFSPTDLTAELEIVKGPVNKSVLEPTNYVCRIGK